MSQAVTPISGSVHSATSHSDFRATPDLAVNAETVAEKATASQIITSTPPIPVTAPRTDARRGRWRRKSQPNRIRAAALVAPGNLYNRRWEQRDGVPAEAIRTVYNGVDPDEFASRFGKQVTDDDYASAIRHLLADNPLEKGRAAYDYVRETYETSKALAAHQEQYERFAA